VPCLVSSRKQQKGHPLDLSFIIHYYEIFIMSKVAFEQVTSADQFIEINAIGNPSAGGAESIYFVEGMIKEAHPQMDTVVEEFEKIDHLTFPIVFHEGPLIEGKANGLTNEILLAICKYRLKCFQAGPFPHESNDVALHHINLAIQALQSRTLERRERGVEGKLEK
jgi:hypothetical protein